MPVSYKPVPGFRWDDDNPLHIAESETTKSNQALFDYAMMGYSRSLRGLIVRYREQEKEWTTWASDAARWPSDKPVPEPIPSKSWTTISNWSIRFEWQDRVRRFDELEREREAMEFQVERTKVAKQRRQLAMAFFQKTAIALSALNPNQAMGLPEITKAVQTSLEQLRAEFGDDDRSGGSGRVRMVQVLLAEGANGEVGVGVKFQNNAGGEIINGHTDDEEEEDDG